MPSGKPFAALTGAAITIALSVPAALAASGGGITHRPFGKVSGKTVQLYTLRNSNGVEAAITNYGGIVVSLKTPDRNGKFADVVLGFDSLDGYTKEHPYFGAIVGRYGNRIAKGRFKLNGVEYKLATNNGENALHGGLKGFDKVVWTPKEISSNSLTSARTAKRDTQAPSQLPFATRLPPITNCGLITLPLRTKTPS
jgi:aldose 1-epimerase